MLKVCSTVNRDIFLAIGLREKKNVVLPTYSITAVMMKWLSKDEGDGTKTKEWRKKG